MILAMACSHHILLCLLFAVSLLWIAKAEKVMNNFQFNQPTSREQMSRAFDCAIKQRESKEKYFDVDACMRVDGHHDEKLTMEKDLDECSSSPCGTESTCKDKVNGYGFHCAAGYTGVHCETDVCMSMPCLNSGTCGINGNGDYICSCPPAFTGLTCETFDPCSPLPCQNGGTCTPSADGSSYTCSCVTLVTGVNCETGPEWIMHAGQFYYISTTLHNYTDSRAICLGLGAELINIESDAEQTFAASVAPGGDFWLSIYKSTPGIKPGTWVINPDSSQEITYSKWYTGDEEPNQVDARCARALSDYDYRWGDYMCRIEYYYICER